MSIEIEKQKLKEKWNTAQEKAKEQEDKFNMICSCGNELELTDLVIHIPYEIQMKLNLITQELQVYSCDKCAEIHFHGINDTGLYYEF